MSGKAGQTRSFRAPRGTRDFYPDDMRVRRYIEDAWRRVSTRHAFEEIDGPRFEHLDLYTVKSGEGIASELFSFERQGGETRYALRPEFTPTLARMVAARASALPVPSKWFSVGPYFRAERPQRGRLREFLQLNCDIIGDPSPEADAELIACCVDILRSLDLTSDDVKIRVSHREAVGEVLADIARVPHERMDYAFTLLDRRSKLSDDEFVAMAEAQGFAGAQLLASIGDNADTKAVIERAVSASGAGFLYEQLGLKEWIEVDPSIVRGLAYYTGMVFEVHETTGKERAIAGGGRYDNLVELFGGAPTPCVGFAMGDVTLANVLEDRGLLPQGADMLGRLGQRPDVFVIPQGDDAERAFAGAVARLRSAGLHARRTHKSTRNVGKLLKEAAASGARFALLLESAASGQLKDLASGAQEAVDLDAVPGRCGVAPAR